MVQIWLVTISVTCRNLLKLACADTYVTNLLLVSSSGASVQWVLSCWWSPMSSSCILWETTVQRGGILDRIVENKETINIITISRRYMISMFLEALFTIAKTWKQTECLPSDEWIMKMWCTYYSAIKTKEILPFAITWMDLEKNFTKWRNPDKEKQISIRTHLYVQSTTNKKTEFIDTENRSMDGGGMGKTGEGNEIKNFIFFCNYC